MPWWLSWLWLLKTIWYWLIRPRTEAPPRIRKPRSGLPDSVLAAFNAVLMIGILIVLLASIVFICAAGWILLQL